MNESTQHVANTAATLGVHERPKYLPRLSADDFCKARYSHQDKRCYTARLLDVFLEPECPYVEAYREFRLASMDYLYENHKDDHAGNGEQRSAGWNSVAERLGYELVDMPTYKAWWQKELERKSR